MYGPGVAAQVNEFLTRALGNPKRMPGSLCTQKSSLQRGTVDSARSPLTHHRPLVDL